MASDNAPGALPRLSPIDTEGKNRNQILSLLVTALQNLFPRVAGSFTLAAAVTTTVTQPSVAAGSFVFVFPTNAAAASLMGSAKSLYHSATAPGASFSVATANGVAASGTETFSYFVLTLV